MKVLKLRHFAMVGLAALGLVASGCDKKTDNKKAEGTKSEAPLVGYAIARTTEMPQIIKGSGTIAAWQEVPVGSEVGGLTAVSLLVDEGQFVQKGQVLLQMNDVLLAAQYRQAAAQAEQSQKAYERAKSLFDKGFLSQAALDSAESSYKTSAATLDTARTQKEMATVRAPVSGIVISRKAVMGQIVSSGAELFRIVRDGAIELNMELTEDEISRVQQGQTVSVINDDRAITVPGKVRVVTPQIDSSTRLGYARVTVPWSSQLRPGMFARAEIDLGKQTVIIIPQKAVIFHENKPGVYRAGNDGRVRYTFISVGETVGQDVIVLNGVNEGDHVVTTGAGFLVDGDKVRFDASKSANGGAN